MNQQSALVTCAQCGIDGGAYPPLDWATSTEDGRTLAYCPRCVRDHVRSIEARLDPAYW